jgi:outer membrane protein
MMRKSSLAAAVTLVTLAGLTSGAAAQSHDATVKFGAIRYDTHSKTNGVSGIGVPPGADATTGDATTVLLTYERLVTPAIGIELVVGVPPKITARATGSVAFLGDVLSARNVAPTLLVNYHFGAKGDALRPYVGAGINYTRFTDVKTTLPASKVELGDSTGLALQAGVDYAIDERWGVFASVAKVDVKSKLVATGATVLQSTIDFRPITFAVGVSWRY